MFRNQKYSFKEESIIKWHILNLTINILQIKTWEASIKIITREWNTYSKWSLMKAGKYTQRK